MTSQSLQDGVSGLVKALEFYRDNFKPVVGKSGIEYRPTEDLLDDCGTLAMGALKKFAALSPSNTGEKT